MTGPYLDEATGERFQTPPSPLPQRLVYLPETETTTMKGKPMTIDITATPEKWREGDTASFKYKGHPVSGGIWRFAGGTWNVGVMPVLYPSGSLEKAFTDLVVTREAPSLPTEPGSVIRWRRSSWKAALRNELLWSVDADDRDYDDNQLLALIGHAVWEQASFPSDEVTS